jgi:hypothetical protein
MILWCTEPLRGKDLEAKEYIRCYTLDEKTAVSDKWLGKRVPAETRCTQFQWKRGVFDVVRAACYEEDNWGNSVS